MTRKDYVKIAAALASEKPSLGSEVIWDSVVRTMAEMLVHDNPRFDRARFYKACGMVNAINGSMGESNEN